jgi:molybdopterin converting factor small subunit
VKVDVRLFGRYRELAAGPSVTLELPPGATVADLVSELHRRSPGKLPERPVVAVDRRPAADDVKLDGGDEVALIPPVAGG